LVVYKFPSVVLSAAACLDYIFNLGLVGNASVNSVFILVFHVEVFDGSLDEGLRSSNLLSFGELSLELEFKEFLNNLVPFFTLGEFLVGIAGNWGCLRRKSLSSSAVHPFGNALFGFFNGMLGESNKLDGLGLSLFGESLSFQLVHLDVVFGKNLTHVGFEFGELDLGNDDQNVREHAALVLGVANKALTTTDVLLVNFVRKVACQIVVSFFLGDSVELILKILNFILFLA